MSPRQVGLLASALLVLAGCASSANSCGGRELLEGIPGGSCGACGAWVCDGTGRVRCREPAMCRSDAGVTDASGSDGGLSGADACTANACGGCASLTGEPGAQCGGCGSAWQCGGPDEVICETLTPMPPTNACGGCSTLDGAPGERCGLCGTLVCATADSLVCNDPCDGGAACATNEECGALGHCPSGHCAPVGWVYVPAGTYVMGAPLSERGLHEARENGQHSVELTRPFLVSQTQVTQGQWRDLTGTTPSFFSACGDDCPVDRVSWWEMLVYANMLSRRNGLPECYQVRNCVGTLGAGCPGRADNCTGFWCDAEPPPDLGCLGFRLPTESEWEYFARAGTTTAFLTRSGAITYWTASPLDPELDEIAWYVANSQVTYPGAWDCSAYNPALTCGTHPVGLKLPNAWGLYDITGNVWERVWDWMGTYPAPGSTATDPTGPETGTTRVVRGGPFNAYAQYMRVAYRTGPQPAARYYNIGFRLVRGLTR